MYRVEEPGGPSTRRLADPSTASDLATPGEPHADRDAPTLALEQTTPEETHTMEARNQSVYEGNRPRNTNSATSTVPTGVRFVGIYSREPLSSLRFLSDRPFGKPAE